MRFNIDFYSSHSPQYCKLTDIFSLMQAFGEATHITPTGKETLIDWALVSQSTKLKRCAMIPPITNSDHNGLMLEQGWKQHRKQTRQTHDKFGGM